MAIRDHSRLDEAFRAAAARFPDNTAVEGEDEDKDGAPLTYADLDARSEALADQLRAAGVQPGDRVGLYTPKCPDAVVAVIAILKAGAAYVPADASGPAERSAFVFNDCGVAAIVADPAGWAKLAAEFGSRAAPERAAPEPAPAVEPAVGTGLVVAPRVRSGGRSPDLAYILYTSGSTGKPKGVMLSHGNALAFLRWCEDALAPLPEDRFSSHAPFHFDLSILDLYVPLLTGGAVVLVGEALGRNPRALPEFIADRRLTAWYSTPSILRLLLESGRLGTLDFSSLRLVLFAGEVFPIKQLRALTEALPQPRYLNLYGPTETNVCTFLEIPTPIPSSQDSPFPIGHACSGDRARVVDPSGHDVAPGEVGELCIAGPSVMAGYWNLPDRTADAFLPAGERSAPGATCAGDHSDAGGAQGGAQGGTPGGSGTKRWYRTGDLVIDLGGGCYDYRGRRDRMVKRRGFRVELGEIEAALYKHPQIQEAAAIAQPDDERGTLIKVFLAFKPHAHAPTDPTGPGSIASAGNADAATGANASPDAKPPSSIQLRQFCAQNLLHYMIPDRFEILPTLPKTSTDKVDYQALQERGQSDRAK